ncbi:hypothetical protein BC834DRAFT_973009 [Gloeopeniophorella convolvens]|nr:hypothetical protein BC834DRAFT_973009 [Gloeopeniophorella convolvens]
MQKIMREISSETNRKTLDKLDKDLMHVRITGYLLVHAPTDTALAHMVRSIHSCKTDEDLVETGRFFDENFLRWFRKFPVPTYKWSHDVSRPSCNNTQELVKAMLVHTPQNHSQAKQSALARDNFRCVFTGAINQGIFINHYALFSDPSEFEADVTECCHVIPEGINSFSVREVDDEMSSSANVWTIFRHLGYPNFVDELVGAGVYSLTNTLTMKVRLRLHFDRLTLWLDATNIPNRYKVCTAGGAIAETIFHHAKAREFVEFTSTDASLALPSAEYLALRAACCRVAILSGAADWYNKLEKDAEELELGTPNASSTFADILTTRLIQLGDFRRSVGV